MFVHETDTILDFAADVIRQNWPTLLALAFMAFIIIG